MDKLIKTIRLRAHMSQEQFAKELKTTPLSIDRWENGKTLPNEMAQSQLFDFCKAMGMDLLDDIIANIKGNGDGPLLYHGSKSGIKGKIAPLSRPSCDFGKGFFDKRVTEEGLFAFLSALELGEQYVYKNEKACALLALPKEKPLSELALSSLRERGFARRKEAVALAEEIYDKETLFWTGCVYRVWYYEAKESGEEIYKQAKAKDMRIVYYPYHCLNVEMAIARLKETYQEKKKKR